MLYEFWEDSEDFEFKVFSDSDWAGDRDTRRSRSGGVALLAGCTVKSWSNRQATPAMSSAEAEYYAMVKASAEALGIQALAADLGWAVRIRLCVDSSAAKAMASRSGVGRVRHMEVRFLRLQDVVMRKRLELKKICGKKNPADVLTKPLSHSVVRELLSACRLGFEDRPGTDVRGEERGVGDSNPSLPPADSVQRRGVRPLLARAVWSAQSTGDDRK